MFYDKLIYLCQTSGVAPSKVAADIGLTRSSATCWRRGSLPSQDNIVKIAEYFSIEPRFLYDDELDIEKSNPQPRIMSKNNYYKKEVFTIPVNSEEVSMIKLIEQKPSLRLLFHSAKTASDEQILETALALEKMKRGQSDS